MTGFGISLSPPKGKEIYTIHRFKIYDAGKHDLLDANDRRKNVNFNIIGEENERLVLRLFMNESMEFYKGRYYFLNEMDPEMCQYLVLELVRRLKLKYKFTTNFELKEVEHS